MNGEPDTLKTAELAKLLRCCPCTLRRRAAASVALRGCIVYESKRVTEWSVQRLRDRGFLCRREPVAVQPIAFAGFTYQVAPLAVSHA